MVHSFVLGLILPPCGQTNEKPLSTLCNKFVKHHGTFSERNSGKALARRSQTAELEHPQERRWCHGSARGTWARGAPHCLLLSRTARQSSDHDRSLLWEGLVGRCLLWQAVNRMCSHDGLASTPDENTTEQKGYISHTFPCAHCGVCLIKVQTQHWGRCWILHPHKQTQFCHSLPFFYRSQHIRFFYIFRNIFTCRSCHVTTRLSALFCQLVNPVPEKRSSCN